MTQTPYDPTLTETMQTAAELILLKKKGDWIAWVLFLLAEMEDTMDEQDYAELLQGLQSSITSRLHGGSW